YWNEFHPIVQVRAKGKTNKGDLVFLDHIMDIERVLLPEGLVAADVGICYVFSFDRSEEHTSELQSRGHLVCRLLLEKKKKYILFLPRQMTRRVLSRCNEVHTTTFDSFSNVDINFWASHENALTTLEDT